MARTATADLAAMRRRLPNVWDLAAILVVFGVLVALARVGPETLKPLSAPEATAISLDPSHLPAYALRTTLRMFAALFASLVFTFTFATLAAKAGALAW